MNSATTAFHITRLFVKTFNLSANSILYIALTYSIITKLVYSPMPRKHRKRHFRKAKSSWALAKRAAHSVISQTIEKYRLLSFVSNIPIGSVTGRNSAILMSITGGITPGLEFASLNENTDAGMKSLFVLQPLGGVSQTATPQVTGQGDGGYGASSLSVYPLPSGGSFYGVASLRGNEAKLLTYHYSLIVESVGDPVLTAVKPSQFRMMIFETRRPLSQQLWDEQIFMQGHVRTANLVTGTPISLCAFPNLSCIKKIYYDRLHTVGVRNFTKKGRIRINRKCYWKAVDDVAATTLTHMQYQGPFIYMLFFGEQQTAVADQLIVSASTLLTYNDA